MQVKIAFRGMSRSPGLEALVHAWATRLYAIYGRLQRCEVVIEAPHRRRRHGDPCRVRVALSVPGGLLTVSHQPGPAADTDVYLTVRDAFRVARRRLEDHVHRVLQRDGHGAARAAVGP